jgi:hypothetical protein
MFDVEAKQPRAWGVRQLGETFRVENTRTGFAAHTLVDGPLAEQQCESLNLMAEAPDGGRRFRVAVIDADKNIVEEFPIPIAPTDRVRIIVQSAS